MKIIKKGTIHWDPETNKYVVKGWIIDCENEGIELLWPIKLGLTKDIDGLTGEPEKEKDDDD